LIQMNLYFFNKKSTKVMIKIEKGMKNK